MEFLYYPFRIHIRAQKVTQNAHGVLPRLLFRPFCPPRHKQQTMTKKRAWRFQRAWSFSQRASGFGLNATGPYVLPSKSFKLKLHLFIGALRAYFHNLLNHIGILGLVTRAELLKG